MFGAGLIVGLGLGYNSCCRCNNQCNRCSNRNCNRCNNYGGYYESNRNRCGCGCGCGCRGNSRNQECGCESRYW